MLIAVLPNISYVLSVLDFQSEVRKEGSTKNHSVFGNFWKYSWLADPGTLSTGAWNAASNFWVFLLKKIRVYLWWRIGFTLS